MIQGAAPRIEQSMEARHLLLRQYLDSDSNTNGEVGVIVQEI